MGVHHLNLEAVLKHENKRQGWSWETLDSKWMNFWIGFIPLNDKQTRHSLPSPEKWPKLIQMHEIFWNIIRSKTLFFHIIFLGQNNFFFTSVFMTLSTFKSYWQFNFWHFLRERGLDAWVSLSRNFPSVWVKKTIQLTLQNLRLRYHWWDSSSSNGLKNWKN